MIGVFSDQHGQHGVMLEGKRDKRRFLMVIGAAEATAIAVPLENVTPPRPLTHDLFLTLFGRLKVQVTKVVITDLRNNTYYATVYLTAGGTAMELDSRPVRRHRAGHPREGARLRGGARVREVRAAAGQPRRAGERI